MDNLFKITPKKRAVKIKSKKGVIYSNPSGIKRLFFHLGTFLVLASIIGLGYIYQPVFNSWIAYKKIDQNEVKEITDNIKNVSLVSVEQKENIDNFDISIPKIGAEAKIIKNVSPYSKDEYMNVLKDNVIAQSNVSSLPNSGKGKTTYLFAHSTQQDLLAARENSVFYLLGELNEGDVILINYRGDTYTYKVYTKKVIGAKETEYLTYKEDDKELLVLQTCWPIGTNWQRLLVFAERIQN